MSDIAEKVCGFIFLLIIAAFFMWLRYLQADKNIYCVFDSSPRTCAVLMRSQND